MSKRKFDNQAERDIALTYLCSLSPNNIYFKRYWDVSESTIKQSILEKRSIENWIDPLVEHYRDKNRAANAIHLYLSVNGQWDDLPCRELVDSEKYKIPIDLVRGEVFERRKRKINEDMGLDSMFYRNLTPHEKLIKAVINEHDNVFPADVMIEPIIKDELIKLYELLKDKGTTSQRIYGIHKSPKKLLDRAYINVKSSLCQKLGEAWRAYEYPVVRETVSKRTERIEQGVDEEVNKLSYREREIIKLRYGTGDGYSYTLEEVAQVFKITRERIRQIEEKAVRKLQREEPVARIKALLE